MKYGLVLEHPKSEMFTLLDEGSLEEMQELKERLQEHWGTSSNVRTIVPETEYPLFGYDGYATRTPHLNFLR